TSNSRRRRSRSPSNRSHRTRSRSRSREIDLSWKRSPWYVGKSKKKNSTSSSEKKVAKPVPEASATPVDPPKEKTTESHTLTVSRAAIPELASCLDSVCLDLYFALWNDGG